MSSKYNLLREIVCGCMVTVCDPCFPFKIDKKRRGNRRRKRRKRRKESEKNFA